MLKLVHGSDSTAGQAEANRRAVHEDSRKMSDSDIWGGLLEVLESPEASQRALWE